MWQVNCFIWKDKSAKTKKYTKKDVSISLRAQHMKKYESINKNSRQVTARAFTVSHDFHAGGK